MTLRNEWASTKLRLGEQARHIRNMNLAMWLDWLFWTESNDS